MEKANGIIFKIASKHLESVFNFISNKKTSLLQILEESYKNKYSLADFLGLLQERIGIEQKDLAGLVLEIFKSGIERDIVTVAMVLGQYSKSPQSYKILPKSWLSRQFDLVDLKDSLSEKWWPLFKDPSWIEKNKKVKYIDIK